MKAPSTGGPTIVGNVRYDTTATGWRAHWAIGNLTGLYGNGTVYGAAFGDAGSGVNLQVDHLYGIRMKDPSWNVYAQLDMSGVLTLGQTTKAHLVADATSLKFRKPGGAVSLQLDGTTGSLFLQADLVAGALGSTRGKVRSAGATDWNVGSGFCFDAPDAALGLGGAKALIGDAAGKRLQWDGTNLHLDSGYVRIMPTTGITVLGTPTSAWQQGYGYNITSATYGGWEPVGPRDFL